MVKTILPRQYKAKIEISYSILGNTAIINQKALKKTFSEYLKNIENE